MDLRGAEHKVTKDWITKKKVFVILACFWFLFFIFVIGFSTLEGVIVNLFVSMFMAYIFMSPILMITNRRYSKKAGKSQKQDKDDSEDQGIVKTIIKVGLTLLAVALILMFIIFVGLFILSTSFFFIA